MMYEGVRKPLVIAAAAFGGAAIFGYQALEDRLSGHPSIPRCFDKPQSEPPYTLHEPKVMRQPVSHGTVQNDPLAMSQAEISHATDSLVEITTDDRKGTGFVTEAHGHRYVVTAAHVVGTAALSNIQLTSQNGNYFKPTGGCYMYEDSGKLHRLTDNLEGPAWETDLAVLQVDDIDTDSLKLRAKRPKAGTWVDFVNYQAANGPKDSLFNDDLYKRPATYNGMVSPARFDRQLQIITGARDLGKHVTRKMYEAHHIQSGASGGPVLQDGKVVGVSVSGPADNTYLGAHMLRRIYSVSFPGADNSPDSGFNPSAAGVVSARMVIKALGSKTLSAH